MPAATGQMFFKMKPTEALIPWARNSRSHAQPWSTQIIGDVDLARRPSGL